MKLIDPIAGLRNGDRDVQDLGKHLYAKLLQQRTGMAGMSDANKRVSFNQIITTEDFTRTTGVKMVAGRDFSKEIASDSSAILLNCLG